MHALFAIALSLQAAGSGDKAVVKIESTVELDILVRDGNGESTKLLNLLRKDVYAQERLDARSLRIQCSSSKLQRSGTDLPLEEKATALSGKTFMATRTDAGWNVRDEKGGSAPAEGSQLGAWNDLVRILPVGGNVQAGGKWSVDVKEILPLLYPGVLTEGAGRLDCVCQSLDGGRANITLSGSITGKGGDDGTTAVSLTVKSGTLIYDTAKNRPVSLMFVGALETSTDMVEVLRKSNTNEEERRKVGELTVKSRRLEAVFTFE
jgi:hypothetical protein